jgi:hypothetical protein
LKKTYTYFLSIFLYSGLAKSVCAADYAAVARFHLSPLAKEASFDQIRAAMSTKSVRDLHNGTGQMSIDDRVAKVRIFHLRFREPYLDTEFYDNDWVKFGKIRDYVSSNRSLADSPGYEKALIDWREGLRFIEGYADGRPLNSDLLKEIHRVSCKNLIFKGYEGRRLLQQRDSGSITETEFRQSLDKVYRYDQSALGIDHHLLVGKYRSDPKDQLIHSGSRFDEKGQRYFTESEFNRLSENKIMKLVKDSFYRESDGKVRAQFQYLDVQKIEKSVEQIIDSGVTSINTANSLDQKMRIAVQLHKDLISAHPFLDGNGRSVRLFMNLIYKRLGLPPPLRPNELDLEMNVDEAVEFERQQMIEYYNLARGRPF